jgi:hypothetical protein
MTEERARHYAKALVRSGACRKRPPRRPYPLAEGNERHGLRQSLTWPGDRGFESAFPPLASQAPGWRPLAWGNGFPRLQRINARESLLSRDQPNLW